MNSWLMAAGPVGPRWLFPVLVGLLGEVKAVMPKVQPTRNPPPQHCWQTCFLATAMVLSLSPGWREAGPPCHPWPGPSSSAECLECWTWLAQEQRELVADFKVALGGGPFSSALPAWHQDTEARGVTCQAQSSVSGTWNNSVPYPGGPPALAERLRLPHRAATLTA